MMEQLFKLSELESRIPVNMNVLVDGVTPRVVSLAEALKQWIDHRRDVLIRRSRHRLAAIEKRLELIAGLVVVFLNLDEVIRIIREEDDAKQALIDRFSLGETQVNYILDTRLRSLRRLEEMALRKEESDLLTEKADIDALLASEKRQWQAIAYQIRDVRKKYGPETPLGKRRTTFEAPPDVDMEAAERMVEREPLTVIVSQKGWIRALKGHLPEIANVAFKGDDALWLSFFAETTSRILALTSDGKAFTLEAGKLPGGRSMGEPIRLMADIDESARIVAVWPYSEGEKMLIAASDGKAFVVGQDELISSTRKGRQVMSVDAPALCSLIVPAIGDHVAVIGENRKMLVFPLSQVPEMARGKGVRLQRYKDGGLSDARVFALSEGLTWRDSAGRNFTVAKADLKDWIANRAEAGRLPPKGFPKNNRFEG
jgi:topoisomerase-4 subunit A